ncbi:MAG: prenyltransferase/squalene oxidase repeat-containing protein [Verrucomicrobiota bacterium]
MEALLHAVRSSSPLLTAALVLALSPLAAAQEKTETLPEATPAALNASIRRGVDFLLTHQNEDGSWGSARKTKALNIYAPLPGAHQAYQAGTSGLALTGLIDATDARPEVTAAIEKAAAWTAAELPKLRRADQTTTYNVWGHAYGLRAMTRLYQRETDPAKKAEWVRLGQEQIELVNRYEEVNGGWGYLDLFDGLTTQKPSGLPTSFTTATVLLAMDHAREVMNVKLDDKLVKHAIAGLNAQRTPDFSYVYSFSHRMRPRLDINRPAGSLGRSQACNAALRVFGEKAVTDEVLTTWADRFLAREGFLSNVRKRPVPHEGQFKIAGYFYYYGIYYFTESVKLLPKEKHAPYAKRLAAILLERQEKDGSWWDYPLYDYHQAYGTGYSLMALTWCRDAMKP